MGLAGFVPQSAEFKAKLIGGREIRIELRPYTLADDAWFNQTFETEEKRLTFADIEHKDWADSVCRVLWRLMTTESKLQFQDIKFSDLDEKTGTEIIVNIVGYEKLMHSFESHIELLAGWNAVIKCRGLNDYVEEALKKKIAAKI